MARRHRDKEKGDRIKVIMSGVIALLMVLSVFGILLGSYSTDMKVGKFKFTQTDKGTYETKIDDKTVAFYSLPADYSYFFNITGSPISRIKNSYVIATTFDPAAVNESAPYIEVARFDWATYMSKKLIFNGVLSPADAYASLPMIGCENATESSPVIVFNVSDRAEIHEYGNCIYFNGKGNDFLRMRDAVLYEYYGVLNDGKVPQ